MVVAKGEGDLKHSMRIEEDPYDLLICKKSSEVRFGMGWVTVHNSKGQAWLVHTDKSHGGITLSTTPGSSTTLEELRQTRQTTDSGSDAEDAKSKSEGNVQSEEVLESSKLTDTEAASILSEKHQKLEEASRKRAA